ncbi:MAG: RNA polymerase factor sigma-54 [Paludibacteraceae bacterium]|nr:RNA polymerase factor sigma-54 [Paludibacteraceae bacterium]
MLQQKLQLKLLTKLSPQQIQTIKLLEIPTLELEERIRQEVEENPALEIIDDPITSSNGETQERSEEGSEGNDDLDGANFEGDNYLNDYKTEDDIPEYALEARSKQEAKMEGFSYISSETLQEHLLNQLRFRTLKKELKEVAEYVIGNVDEYGYLRRSAESMVDDYSFQTGKIIRESVVEQAVELIKSFDPAGVGANSLEECLLLQLERKTSTPQIETAKLIISKSFVDLSQKRYDRIVRDLGIEEKEIKEAISEIIKLNPKPGNAWDSSSNVSNIQITPDFIVENENGELNISLNQGAIPELNINRNFAEMLDEYSNNKSNQTREMKEAAIFVKQKLDSAKWFISAVKQRHETLRSVIYALVEAQKEFFLSGDETKLKPLILKDIADKTGYDVSTISRVSNSKYVQTEFGIFPIKYLFTDALQTTDGDVISTKGIKTVLEECIKNEDKKNPLTDDRLMEILAEKGYTIARRTVAKYREQLNFPVARLRKEL